ncbi:hypothetical protein JTE90_009723 [Oedothorax gibbosus]|uniref:Sulfotransferase domain-containing protein n=1 Tax=Oedothorax gibbosus TaxID=931172 RepID=A0AAV6V9S4_9ARAC|nr:hypothetical protein JTE90_009723 [Oedothorax gibbosus]
MSVIQKKPLYVKVNGIYLCKTFSPQCFQEALDYKPKPGDVFICTYPKCGTTWVQNIALYIFRKGKELEDPLDVLRCTPFIDKLGQQGIERMPRPGAFKTHLPFSHIPYSSEAKYIFVARNPKDCCTSFFHHTKMLPGFGFWNGTFDEFFEVFMEGEVEYGDYFDHLLSWYPHRNDPNVFYTTFENMKNNASAVTLDLAKFLGEEYIEAIEKDSAVLDNILLYSGLDYMKKNEIWNPKYITESKQELFDSYDGFRYGDEFLETLDAPKDLPDTIFVRKGVVGDWKNHLSPEQNERLERRFLERLKGTEVLQWYPIEE